MNVCGHMAVLRMICYNQDVGQLTCLILPVDLTQFHQECLYLMIGSDDLLLVEIRNGGIIVESCQM